MLAYTSTSTVFLLLSFSLKLAYITSTSTATAAATAASFLTTYIISNVATLSSPQSDCYGIFISAAEQLLG